MLEIEPLEVWVLDNSAPKGWKINVSVKKDDKWVSICSYSGKSNHFNTEDQENL